MKFTIEGMIQFWKEEVLEFVVMSLKFFLHTKM